MLAEIIMHRMGWGEVWYADPGPISLRRLIANPWMIWPGGFHVGVWTGPQNDLLCVKHCATNAEAERFLSPAAPTILAACLAALWKARSHGIRPIYGAGGEFDRRHVPFVEACCSGDVEPDDVDLYVEAWHATPEADDGRSLPEWLGFTDEEYSRWVERPSSVFEILRAHGWRDSAAIPGREGTCP